MRLPTILVCLLNACSLFPIVSSWKFDVHNQIGFMAEYFMSDSAKWMVGMILEPEYQGSIGRAAHWADTVSKTTHKYSYGWHWTSAKDDPPHNCNLYYWRDCQAGGCSISQIQNQTFILQGCIQRLRDGYLNPGNPDVNCQQALKWLVHFIGDITEPMHNSYNFFGGNLFKVTFNGTETNMHQTWDQHIIYSTLGIKGFPQTSISPFAADLVARINADAMPVPRSDWILCADTSRPVYCATLWAKDSNALTCDFVYGRYVNGSDLWKDGSYAADAFPIIQLQIAKAVWRLAGWMNNLAQNGLGRAEGDEGVMARQGLLPGVDHSIGSGSLMPQHVFAETDM